MLSIFPNLFNYSYAAPLILRVAVAVVLLRIGYASFKISADKNKKAIGIAQIITAIFLLAGFLTQAAVIVAGLTVILEALREQTMGKSIKRKALKLLILAICLSLLILGPGLFAFDLPL